MSELEERAAAAGRSTEDQRAYERGYEQAQERIREMVSVPVPVFTVPEMDPRMLPDQFRSLPRGDRGTWARSTTGGQLAWSVSPDAPDEQSQEARKAREFADHYEYVYGRRPSATEARAAVARRVDGVWLSGSAEEIGSAFRRAGVPLSVITDMAPLPPDSSVIVQAPR